MWIFPPGSGGDVGGPVALDLSNATVVGSDIWSGTTEIAASVPVPASAMASLSTAESVLFWDTGLTPADLPAIDLDIVVTVDAGTDAQVYVSAGVVISAAAPASVNFATDKSMTMNTLRGLAALANSGGSIKAVVNNNNPGTSLDRALHEKMRFGGVFIGPNYMNGVRTVLLYNGGLRRAEINSTDSTGFNSTDTVYIIVVVGRDKNTGSTIDISIAGQYSAVPMA